MLPFRVEFRPGVPACWKIRTLESRDQSFLWEMLYVALWDAPDEPRKPRSVVEKPAMKRLVEDWGREEDHGLVAMDPETREVIGAIWARLDGYDGVEGYGCEYPVMGMAVEERYHGQGVGTLLLREYLESLKGRVSGIRLGVHPKNAVARGLYEKMGFREYAIGGGAYPQMKLELERG